MALMAHGSPSGHIDLISSARTNALRNVPSALTVDICIHVTQNHVLHSGSDTPFSGHKFEMVAEKSKEQPPTTSVLGLDINLIPGRPDIHAILKEEVDGTRGGRLGVGGASHNLYMSGSGPSNSRVA